VVCLGASLAHGHGASEQAAQLSTNQADNRWAGCAASS